MASMKRWRNECHRHIAQNGVRQCLQQIAIWLMCARRRQRWHVVTGVGPPHPCTKSTATVAKVRTLSSRRGRARSISTAFCSRVSAGEFLTMFVKVTTASFSVALCVWSGVCSMSTSAPLWS